MSTDNDEYNPAPWSKWHAGIIPPGKRQKTSATSYQQHYCDDDDSNDDGDNSYEHIVADILERRYPLFGLSNVSNLTSNKIAIASVSNGSTIKKRTLDRFCEVSNCVKNPCFNHEGQIKGRFCSSHRLQGMIDVITKHCEASDCEKRPYFNHKGHTNGRFCSSHRLKGMVDVKHKHYHCEASDILTSFLNFPFVCVFVQLSGEDGKNRESVFSSSGSAYDFHG
jgi:hypothetical protein